MYINQILVRTKTFRFCSILYLEKQISFSFKSFIFFYFTTILKSKGPRESWMPPPSILLKISKWNTRYTHTLPYKYFQFLSNSTFWKKSKPKSLFLITAKNSYRNSAHLFTLFWYQILLMWFFLFHMVFMGFPKINDIEKLFQPGVV